MAAVTATERAAPARAWRRPLAGLVLSVAAGTALSASVAAGDGILGDRWTILARLALWSLAWAAAVGCALRLPRRTAALAVLAGALALRLAALAGPPALSDDLHRYSWDGRVQAAGIDPYRHAPAAAQLSGLREGWLWPDEAGCAELGRAPGCSRVNRATVRTIYPPLAESWFAAVHRVAGIGARHKAWQVAGLAVDMALVAVLPAVLRAWRRDERWSALYALSPVPVLEVVNNGHVDGLAALLAVVALLAVARRRPGLAGALVGAAALVKIYPAVLLVGLVAAPGRARPGRWRAAAAAGAVVAVGYLPHVLRVGPKVLGYLPGYLREEDYGGGGRYLLAGMLGLPPVLTTALAAGAVAAAAVWVMRHRPPAPGAGALLMGSLLLAATPVQPWYGVVLLAVATVAGAPAWAAVVVAGYPYFFAVILDAAAPVAVGRLSYGVALTAVAAALATARSRARAPAVGDDPASFRSVRPG